MNLYVILVITEDGDEFFPPNGDGKAGIRTGIFSQVGKRGRGRCKISPPPRLNPHSGIEFHPRLRPRPGDGNFPPMQGRAPTGTGIPRPTAIPTLDGRM